VPEDSQGPATQRFQYSLHNHQATERQSNNHQQVSVRLRQCFIDDQLQLERSSKCRDLQS
jgi:hypothetical protein